MSEKEQTAGMDDLLETKTIEVYINGKPLVLPTRWVEIVITLEDGNDVTVERYKDQEIQNDLPDHNDYGDPCWHREQYEAVVIHTPEVPFPATLPNRKICKECSAAVQEYVEWPCPRMRKCSNCGYDKGPLESNGKCWVCNHNKKMREEMEEFKK